jgi:hypothetical protein
VAEPQQVRDEGVPEAVGVELILLLQYVLTACFGLLKAEGLAQAA